ncbi:glycosyltransferase [Plantactinospora soyae]|uniref:Glycosyltransferase involved in cell wall biosynthesis n=1 Tax=Plantactinospora soyae TaxID=1544732 RepID=A0A927M2M2_9ACTN|nr:glycosyltransferase [Plantactinospora soyae]MBE1485636.1 glycosyltransferase involved in cell wall biosynthesis [Plantactinospora soyae]
MSTSSPPHQPNPQPSVVIWRSGMLAASETFIRNQGNALTRWQPTFLGATKVTSAIAADTDIVAYPDTPADRRAFLRLRLTGESPRLRNLLAGLRPALVHAHFGNDGWLVSGTARQLGVPLLVTLHGYDVTRQPDTSGVRGVRYRRNLRQVFDRATLLLAVSGFIRDRAVALGADPAKVLVHHTGVPLAAGPADPSAVPKKWDVVFVGRFVEKKGVDDLLEAVGMLRGRRPRMLLIGSGPLEQPMRERAAALGLSATFLGAQEPAAVARHLAESRIFVSPSKTASDGDSEGLPTTILEASSLGLPTVSTYHSGIPEAVLHGETGLLGAEGDRSALADGIARLLDDEELRTRFGRRARRHVEENFDLRKQTHLLESLYETVAGRAGLPAPEQQPADVDQLAR